MKVVVNCIAASKGGALSVLEDFYTHIRSDAADKDWIFLLGAHYLKETSNIKVLVFPKVKGNWLKRLIFDLFSGKKYINNLKPDIVLSMQNTITFGVKCPQIVYIHQAIPFQSLKKFSFFKKRERVLAIYQSLIGWLIKISAKKADKVIVQTKWMKQAICNSVKIDEDKVIVIKPKIEFKLNNKSKNEFNPKSFFYPTSNIFYKNNECLFKAAKILNRQGLHDFNIKMTYKDCIGRTNIEFLGRIPREKVFQEYFKSTLVFPSYIESYPLPLEEAKIAGTIILASDCEFSREILNGYENAYYFDPFNPEQLAKLMKKVIIGQIVKKETNQKCYSISKENGWKLLIRELTINNNERTIK